MPKEKIILTDCDGVLLNWNKAFEHFMLERGFPRMLGTAEEYRLSKRYGISSHLASDLVKEFNESTLVGDLEPFADSVQYVNKLANKGFRFIVVTSISDHPNSKIYRTENLERIFGKVFDDIHCLKTGESKENILLNWAGSEFFWIEDHMRQAEAGHEAGLKTILINHPYNNHYTTDLFPKVSLEHPWKEIYRLIAKDYGLI